MIQLTDQQWAELQAAGETPVRVSDPGRQAEFVLLRAETYERLRPLLELEEERRFQLQEFGRRAGWDDPQMNLYEDLDPRRAP